jgi:hypothetical protein
LLQQKANANPFRASLIEVAGKKLDKFDINNQAHAQHIVAIRFTLCGKSPTSNGATNGVMRLRRSPRAPCNKKPRRKLGFSAKKP